MLDIGKFNYIGGFQNNDTQTERFHFHITRNEMHLTYPFPFVLRMKEGYGNLRLHEATSDLNIEKGTANT